MPLQLQFIIGLFTAWMQKKDPIYELLLPNIPSTEESTLYTSPIKMFEYMASDVPIVASDLPSIREVLNDKNAILVEAGNPEALLRGVEYVLKGEAEGRAVWAKEDVQKYTWDIEIQEMGTGLFSLFYQSVAGMFPKILKIVFKNFALSIDRALGRISLRYRNVAKRIPLGYFVVARKM